MPLQLEKTHLVHEEYARHAPIWKMVQDVLDGKKAIDAEGETYLPRPAGRTDEEYKAYQTRAVLYNATSRTLEGFLGAIFRKDSTVKLHPKMEYLEDNLDGEGNTIIQFAKKATKEVISKGRYGLMVEFPQATNVVTLADEVNANMQARVIGFCPESIINWHTIQDGSTIKLTHVLIKEKTYTYGHHVFNREPKDRYRLLQLDAQGFYEIIIMEPVEVTDDAGKQRVIIKEKTKIKPLLPGRKRLDFIPFIFAGSDTNTSEVNKAPLADLAELNLAHYRNSADYEEAVHMVGQPTPWISGLDDDFIEENRGNIRIGSREGWLLPEGAEVGLLESKAEKNILQKALEMKEEEMIGLGARLVQNNAARGSESAESVQLRRSGESNSLACIAENISLGILKCLEWASLWMNIKSSDIMFKLNKDFFSNRLTHQDILALVQAWQSRAIPHEVLLDNYRKGEIIPETMDNEEVVDLIETEEPFESFVDVNTGSSDQASGSGGAVQSSPSQNSQSG